MTMIVKWLLLFVGFFCFTLSVTLLLSYRKHKRKTGKRLQQLGGIVEAREATMLDDEKESVELWRQVAATVAQPVRSEKLNDQVGNILKQSNIPLRKEEFIGLCILLAAFGFLFGYLLSGLLGGLALAVVAAYVPLLWAKSKVKKRLRAFQDQLVDMLTMTSNSLKAGYSFLQALELISKEMPAPISEEFARLIKEIQLGVTTEAALQNLSSRMKNDDLDLIITAVLIQRQIGGNLAHILDSIAETIRERIRIQREIKALTAQGRMSGHIFRVMPVGLGLLVYIINPKYMSIIFTSPLGWGMLAFAFVGQIIGSILINRIVKIEV